MGIFAGAIDYFQRGGACMWPLLLCSLAAIYWCGALFIL